MQEIGSDSAGKDLFLPALESVTRSPHLPPVQHQETYGGDFDAKGSELDAHAVTDGAQCCFARIVGTCFV